MKPFFRFCLPWAWAILFCVGPTWGEPVKLPCVADVWVSQGNQAERDTSMGRTPGFKLKVNQELALMDFDFSPLKGRKVVRAALYLYPTQATGATAAPERGTDLRWIALSTVSSRWVEGSQARSYQEDPKGRGATFNEASYKSKPWCWPGSTVAHVINGHANSVACSGDLTKADGGYWKVPVDSELVRVLVAGAGHGLSVMDGSSTHTVNCFVASREDADKAPYLLVEVEGEDRTPPAAPTAVKAGPASDYATADHGALAVSLTVPADAVGFDVTVGGQPVERWQIARPAAPGSVQRLIVRDLAPDKSVEATVVAVDSSGNRSQTVKASGKVSPAVAVGKLPLMPFEPKPGSPVPVGLRLSVWAFPEVDKVDPVTGKLLFADQAGQFDQANSVWSGGERLIRVAAARGEIVAFQLALQGEGKPLEARVAISDLSGPEGATIAGDRVNLFRVWYVKAGDAWQGEYAVPMADGRIVLPASDNAVPDQKLQAVYVDIVVPKDVKPGDYRGTVGVTVGDDTAELPLKLVVYPAVIPDELNFNPELNCYGGPARAGSKAFFDYHRLAHYHRCTLNRLPYTQGGQAHPDMLPAIEGKGAEMRVTDWAPYDRNVGPLLDGSAFADNPRASVPVKTFYTTFMENWPLTLADHYKMGAIAKPDPRAITGMEGAKFPGNVSEDVRARRPEFEKRRNWHDVVAPPIEQAFTDDYVQGNISMIGQYVDHFQRKGWTRTQAQIYLNNKYSWGGTWWTLDEPVEWVDFNALAYFGRIYNRGFAGQKDTHFAYRGDISRPEWQGGYLDGIMDVVYFGSGWVQDPDLVRAMTERMPSQAYFYGRCNAVDRGHFESVAWCLSSFTSGGDGVLPWQSIGRESSLTEPNPLGLLVPGKRFGTTALASLRVFALRRGAQDCELLRLLLAQRNWQRYHARLLVGQKIKLANYFRQRFEDEAAPLTYDKLAGRAFVEMKEGLLQLLAEPDKGD